MAEEKRHKTRLIVVTPYKNFYEGDVESISLPSQDGEVGIMAGHMPLVLSIFPGVATIRDGKEIKHCVFLEGYAEIGQHMVLVVCNAAEWPEEIDVRRSHKALLKYKKLLSEAQTGDYKIAGYKEYISRARARLHTVELYGTDKQKAVLQELRDSAPQ